MLYDRMCKKIFRVDGMLLLLLCIVCKVHRSARFVYLTRKIEKIPLKQPDVCLNSWWNAIRCLYTKNCILLFILSYSISRKKTIKSEVSWFISVFLGFAIGIVETRICHGYVTCFKILRTSSKNRVIWFLWWYTVKHRGKIWVLN